MKQKIVAMDFISGVAKRMLGATSLKRWEIGSVVGIATLFDLEDLKRKLLLVDKIAVIHTVDRETDWYCRKRNPTLAADLDWLDYRGVVERVDSTVALHDAGKLQVEIDFSPTGREATLRKMSAIPEALQGIGATIRGVDALDASCDLLCRIVCDRIMNEQALIAVSLCSPGENLFPFTGKSVRSVDVHRVIIEKFPYPDESASLDKILEFRADPESQRTITSLRRWASNVVQANLTAAEIAQEIEYLVGEYERYMKLHEIKIVRGVWETVITTVAQSIEHLFKLQFGGVAKSLFALSSRKIELLEAETKAPGREIAYLALARKNFD